MAGVASGRATRADAPRMRTCSSEIRISEKRRCLLSRSERLGIS